MHAATLLVLCAVAEGCSRSARNPPPAAEASSDVATVGALTDARREMSVKSREPRRIHIAAFDCEKDESTARDPGPTGLVSPASGIRSWHGGGPAGAAWNADDLRCAVRITTTCTRGRIAVVLRVGRAVVAERQQEIDGAQTDLSMAVPFKSWKSAFDQPAKSLDAPYKTAIFRATSLLTCTAPIEVNPWTAWYPSVVDEDAFVAGFAYGE